MIRKQIQTLAPSSFAVVMSTGIVSIGCRLVGFENISSTFFLLNKIQYRILLLMLFARVILFFPEVIKDISAHAKGAGFLTLVAASCLLGMQYVLLEQSFIPAIVLLYFSILMWLLIMYSFFISVIIKKEKPTLEKGLDGSWLLIVVSTQSLSILTATLQNHLPFPVDVIAFISLAAFLLGFVLYVILITLIFYRLLFSPLRPEEFTPPYWIDMGACAITTLAAATFITTTKNNIVFNDLIPFVKTAAVLCWSVSTWWLPIIVILEVWRHGSKKVSLSYNVSYWSIVFPLGMYTVCTFKMADALQFSFLKSVSNIFIYISLLAWLITFAAMIFTFSKSILFAKKSTV